MSAHGRNTNDYSPLEPHTDEYREAVNACKEMLKHLEHREDSRVNQPKRPERKRTWKGQMKKKAKFFDSPANYDRHLKIQALKKRQKTAKQA